MKLWQPKFAIEKFSDMAKQHGLGKGLAALIGATSLDNKHPTDTFSPSEYSLQKLERLLPNPHQPRKDFEPGRIKELANSITQHGLLQPIVVEPSGQGSFIIIAGERRYRAAKLAGLSEVPVVIRKKSGSRVELALIENIQRENLNPIEEAEAYKYLMEIRNCNQETVANLVSRNRSTVANALRLLRLPEKIRTALQENKLSPGHARAILSVLGAGEFTEGCKADVLFQKILREGISVRDAESIAAPYNNPKDNKHTGKSSARQTKSSHLAELKEAQEKLIALLGTKVSIKGNEKNGCIEIHYYSMPELERILHYLEGTSSD